MASNEVACEVIVTRPVLVFTGLKQTRVKRQGLTLVLLFLRAKWLCARERCHWKTGAGAYTLSRYLNSPETRSLCLSGQSSSSGGDYDETLTHWSNGIRHARTTATDPHPPQTSHQTNKTDTIPSTSIRGNRERRASLILFLDFVFFLLLLLSWSHLYCLLHFSFLFRYSLRVLCARSGRGSCKSRECETTRRET